MKKRFEIEWDDRIKFGPGFLGNLLNACWETNDIKVTELKEESTEECECDFEAIARKKLNKDGVCLECGKPIKPQPEIEELDGTGGLKVTELTEECSCLEEVRELNGQKPIKPQPEIEELKIASNYDWRNLGHCINKLNELIRLLKKKGVV